MKNLNYWKNTQKTLLFHIFLLFSKFMNLNFFIFHVLKTPTPALQTQKMFLGKSIRQILRSRCVLSSHNEKRIFSNACIISCRSPAQNFMNFECITHDPGIQSWSICAISLICFENNQVFCKSDFEKHLVGFRP